MYIESFEFKYKDTNYKLYGHKGSPFIKNAKKVNSFYEIDFLEYIRSLDLTGVYIDGGCFVGNHTVYFTNHCNSSFVYSIDADVHFFTLYSKNTQHNILGEPPKYKYILTALMDKKGFVDLNPPKKLPKISCVDVQDLLVKDKGEVTSNTLDNLLYHKNDKIAFIKLDIEGCELKALQGAEKIILRDFPVIAAEAWTKKEQTELIEYLKQFGYKVIKRFTDAPMFVFSKEM